LADKLKLVVLHHDQGDQAGAPEVEEVDGKKIIWKDALVEGHYPLAPNGNPNGITVVANGDSDAEKGVIALNQLVKAHEDKAFKYVTIPDTHKDRPMENRGYVRGLKVVERTLKGGKKVHVLRAGQQFTNKEAEDRALEGSIPDISCGVFHNYTRKTDKKLFPVALKHTALSSNPWMGNLEGYQTLAMSALSDEEGFSDDTEIEVVVAHFDDGEGENSGESSGDDSKVDVIWKETEGFNWLRNQISEALNPQRSSEAEEAEVVPLRPRPHYFVNDVSKDTALVEEYLAGNTRRFVIPYKRNNDGVEIDPGTRWVEVKEAMIAASDDIIKDFDEKSTSTLKGRLHQLLTDQLGPKAAAWVVDDVTSDGRVSIKSKVGGKKYIATFSQTEEGEVFITSEPTLVAPPKADAQRPASAPSNAMLSDDIKSDTPEGRVQAARQRRRALLGRPQSR